MRILFLAILFCATQAFAADIDIEFDHVPVRDVVSYSVFVNDELWGTADITDIVAETGYYRLVTVGDLQYGVPLVFQMVASDASGNEFDTSNTITGTIPHGDAPINLRRIIINTDDGRTIILST